MQPALLVRRPRLGVARRPAAPRFTRRWAALVALAGGLLGVLAYPRFGFWPLAFVSVAALSIAVDGRRARTGAWLGLIYGVAFFYPLIHWVGVYVGPVPWLILATFEAAYVAGLGAALTQLQRLPGAPFWVGAAWVGQEFVRDRWPFGGFPWGRLAFSQAESPVRWFAALGGAPLTSFVVAVGGAALAGATRAALGLIGTGRGEPAGRRPLRVGLGLALVLALAVPAVGAVLGVILAPPPARDSRTTTVALIQGSVPDLGLPFEQRAGQVLDNHVAQTLKLAAEIKAGTVARPSIVLWPENASDLDPLQDPHAAAEIQSAADAVGVPILVGAILNGPGADHRRNVGILWSPSTGPGQMYTKRHPVPFAEYIPLRSVARIFSSDVDLVTQDMVAGHGNGLLTDGPFPLGDVICFEVAYDGLVRSSVRAGAQALVVQTNNATFGHTAETYQQLAMSQLRAVETGRSVLQVATTGLSAVIAPDGTVQQRSGQLFTPDIIVASIPLHSTQTVATRIGPLPEYLLSGLAAVALLGLIWQGRRARRAGRTGGGPDGSDHTADDGEHPVTEEELATT